MSPLVRLAPHPNMPGTCAECGWHHARDGFCTGCYAPLTVTPNEEAPVPTYERNEATVSIAPIPEEDAMSAIITTTAAKLEPGDILSTNGFRVNLVVPSHHGATTYLDMTGEDGWVRCETVPSDTVVHVWRGDLFASCTTVGEEN
jgi:hypothetical protein